jgi:hypothetical protein
MGLSGGRTRVGAADGVKIAVSDRRADGEKQLRKVGAREVELKSKETAIGLDGTAGKVQKKAVSSGESAHEGARLEGRTGEEGSTRPEDSGEKLRPNVVKAGEEETP